MKLITRNKARYLSRDIIKICDNNQILRLDAKELLAYFILWYSKYNNYDGSPQTQLLVYIFTNAYTDIIQRSDSSDESFINAVCMRKSDLDITAIEKRFKSTLDIEPRNFLSNNINDDEREYEVKLSRGGPNSLDLKWFNNSDEYIHPLLSSYQELKSKKQMVVTKEDILQIPIDYTLALSFNHFKQVGFVNTEICYDIANLLTDATNDCININKLSVDKVMDVVNEDIKNPKCIKAAWDFISTL